MDADSSDLSYVQYAGRVKAQTFRQMQFEKLIKEGIVIPASRLAQAKEQELMRAREFVRQHLRMRGAIEEPQN